MRRNDSLNVLSQLDYVRINQIEARQARMNELSDLFRQLCQVLNLPRQVERLLLFFGVSIDSARKASFVLALLIAGISVHPIAVTYAIISYFRLYNSMTQRHEKNK